MSYTEVRDGTPAYRKIHGVQVAIVFYRNLLRGKKTLPNKKIKY